MSRLSERPINSRALAKRDSGSTTALIAAAVVSCVVFAMLSAGGLWIYQRWLRRRLRERIERMEKECPSTPSTTSSSSSSSFSSDSAPPSPALYPVPPRRIRRPKGKGLITKPSIPDLPRISEEPRMSLEPRAGVSASASVHSWPGTVIGPPNSVKGGMQGGGELGQRAEQDSAGKEEGKDVVEEVVNT